MWGLVPGGHSYVPMDTPVPDTTWHGIAVYPVHIFPYTLRLIYNTESIVTVT